MCIILRIVTAVGDREPIRWRLTQSHERVFLGEEVATAGTKYYPEVGADLFNPVTTPTDIPIETKLKQPVN